MKLVIKEYQINTSFIIKHQKLCICSLLMNFSFSLSQNGKDVHTELRFQWDTRMLQAHRLANRNRIIKTKHEKRNRLK